MLRVLQIPVSLEGFEHSKILKGLSDSELYEVIKKAENLKITYWYQSDRIIGKVLHIDENNIASCGFSVEGIKLIKKIGKAKEVTLSPKFWGYDETNLRCLELSICPY